MTEPRRLSPFTWNVENDHRISEYLFAYWRMYPDKWWALNGTEDTTALRATVFEEINAATEGDLARLVEGGKPETLHWIFIFGVCVQAYLREGP